MKRIVSMLVLCAMLCLSIVTMTSCGKKEVDDIDGKTAEEAFNIAIQSLDEISKYDVEISMDVRAKLGFITLYGADLGHCITYKYDGDNEGFYIDSEAMDKAKRKDLYDDVFDGYADLLVYVDGICYEKYGSSKIKYEMPSSPIEDSEFEKDIARIFENGVGDITYFKKGDLYYFTVDITDEEYGSATSDDTTKESYTVYFNENGRITKIVYETEVEEEIGIGNLTIKAKNVCEIKYLYEDIEDIEAPEDADTYEMVE